MPRYQFIIGVAAFGFAFLASAQPVNPNIDLVRSGSTYPFTCVPTEPVGVSYCAVRTDLPADPIELGCAPYSDPSVTIEITVDRTQGIDAEIRCYGIDAAGNVSDYSDNFGRADFTPPGRPFVR